MLAYWFRRTGTDCYTHIVLLIFDDCVLETSDMELNLYLISCIWVIEFAFLILSQMAVSRLQAIYSSILGLCVTDLHFIFIREHKCGHAQGPRHLCMLKKQNISQQLPLLARKLLGRHGVFTKSCLSFRHQTFLHQIWWIIIFEKEVCWTDGGVVWIEFVFSGTSV